MLEFIVIFFGLIFGFSLYTRRFRNPYKLIFIFGKKGAFKSTYMIKQMLKHQKAGWNIYTDVPGCLVPGVRIMDSRNLSTYAPPPNSVLFLDEVGISFDNRKWKEFSDGMRDFMKFQRKYRIKIYMNSQTYDVDPKIRSVVDSMILMTSVADCIGVCRPIRKTVTLTEPSAEKESRIAEKLEFTGIWRWSFIWGPKYFKYFDSFSAPEREPIPFEQITRELMELCYGGVPDQLQAAWNSYENLSSRSESKE